jgi:4-diphosphocytidyl-2-C-methyl-D-erythritol kinase
MKALSPAKINLMLRILGRRNDGYHLLQTYFQLLNWGDELNFELTQKKDIKVIGDFQGLNQHDNLIYKAATLLNPYKKVNRGIKIHALKQIPQGSGLGGGSSNAGTTLRILNKLWHCDLNQDQLQNIAIKLGADVPIFVLNKSAMATGIGENLIPYEIEKHYFVLIFPSVNIATVDIFNDNELMRNQKEIKIVEIHDQKKWTNACLNIVLKNYKQVNNIYKKASKLTNIYMSGTGSTLFAPFKSKQLAKVFINDCPSNWNTQICTTKINGN